MAYKVIILYQLYMPSYFLGTFTEYPYINIEFVKINICILYRYSVSCWGCGRFIIFFRIKTR